MAGLHGAYLRRDVIATLGRRRLTGALHSGEVTPLWSGVVVDAPRTLDPVTRAAAAQLSAGPTAVLAHVTAAHLHGCRSVDPVRTHVLVPYSRAVRSRAGLVVHQGRPFSDDVVDRNGLRLLAFDRVIADLLCILPPPDALATVDEALRLAGDRHDEFTAAIGARLRRRHDPRGTVRARGLLDLASPRAESKPESWLRLLLVESGFPIPEVNWPICTPSGHEIYRLDLAWPNLRIAVEYDGYAEHVGREEQDESRADDLRRRGWILIVARSDDLRSHYRLECAIRAAFRERGYTW